MKLRCCAKCNKSADDVNILPPEPTPQEQMKLDQEMQLLIKKLPERKRRTFLRYMKKGKKKQKEGEGEEGQNGDGDSDPEVDSEGDEEEANKTEVVEPVEKVKEKTIPYTKEELLLKLEQMKLALENDADFEDDFFGSDFDEEEDEDDFDDEDGEEEEEDDSEEEEKPVDVKKKGVTFENGVKK